MLDNNKQSLSFIDKYFFYPNIYHKLLAFILLPISAIYYIIAICRKYIGKKHNFGIKIISIGNLVSGGSGKTPFCIALSQYLESKHIRIAVILRGYKRQSKGLVHVRMDSRILCDVKHCGDEAMLIAKNIQGDVIVSENREIALQYAIKKGIKLVILDDAFRFRFDKFDILLEPKIAPYFNFVLPSGYYRFPRSFYSKGDLVLREGIDYTRHTHISMLCENNNTHAKFVLATAIANPSRLDAYLPNNVVFTYYKPDHAALDEKILESLLHKYNATHILMTAKDYVKCEHFTIPIAILELNMHINEQKLEIIDKYLTT